MALSREMLFSSVRLTGPGDSTNAPNRTLGAGFIVTVRSESDPTHRYAYIVTAAHLVEGRTDIAMRAIGADGGDLYEPVAVTDWRVPIDALDVAVAPCNWIVDDARDYWGFRFEMLFPSSSVYELHLGARIYGVELLAGVNRAFARSGTLGALDQMGVDHNSKSEYLSHLVEYRSEANIAGSPCYLDVPASELANPARLPVGDLGAPVAQENVVLLVGMFTGWLNESDAREPPPSDIGVVLRSQEIKSAITTDELRKERFDWDAEHEASLAGSHRPRPRLTLDSGGVSEDEFEKMLFRATRPLSDRDDRGLDH